MKTAQIGPSCEVFRSSEESEACLKVNARFDLGWRLRSAPSETPFPGTAVLYEGDWYEVEGCELSQEKKVLLWTYELKPWEEGQVFRDTFELNERTVASAAEQWRRRKKPFSLKKSILIVLPSIVCLAIVTATLLVLGFLPMVWVKQRLDEGQVSPTHGRLVVFGAIAFAVGTVMCEIRFLNRRLADLNRRFPWMETERWHARNALILLVALGILQGVGMLWFGAGEWRLVGGCLSLACIMGLVNILRDPLLA